MKKILFSLMAIILAIGLVGAGAFAYFSDVEQSTGNTFQAGTLDLAVNTENPWASKAFTFTDVKPCENLAPFDITFKNVGQNPGVLYTCFNYVENDKPEDVATWFEFSAANDPSMEMSANKFAALVYVAAVEYKYECPADGYVGAWHDDLPNWVAGMDNNSDGKVSLYELKLASPIPYDPSNAPLKATAHITWRITFHLGDSLAPWTLDGHIQTGVPDNRPQADGIDGIVTGILLQVGAPTPPTCP